MQIPLSERAVNPMVDGQWSALIFLILIAILFLWLIYRRLGRIERMLRAEREEPAEDVAPEEPKKVKGRLEVSAQEYRKMMGLD